MKKLLMGSIALTLFSISIIIFQISCKKEANAQNSTNNCIGAQPKIEFKGNGILYTNNARFDNRIGWYNYACIDTANSNPSNTLDELRTGPLNSTSSFMDLFFPNSTNIASGTYTSTNQAIDCVINGIRYYTGSYTININIQSDGTADGTFSGTLYQQNNQGSNIVLTDGVFSSIPVGLTWK